ncbi:MAG: hypothetical protein PF572_00625 [Patescibacteria group bacterium]|jgi:hypothetical protein|nr:hypothetical protein [Patescibacteria group bacterium]
MENLTLNLKNKIKQLAGNKDFLHHKWFVKYHLEIAEKIALELCDIYKEADIDLVMALVWMHDYGKIINMNDQYQETQLSGEKLLLELNFPEDFSQKVINLIEIIDSKDSDKILAASIEVKIVSSADGASHLLGPFYHLWFYESPKKSIESLLEDASRKIRTDWENKIVLPEVKESFRHYFEVMKSANGILPENFLNNQNL